MCCDFLDRRELHVYRELVGCHCGLTGMERSWIYSCEIWSRTANAIHTSFRPISKIFQIISHELKLVRDVQAMIARYLQKTLTWWFWWSQNIMLDLDQQTSWEPVLGLHRADHQRAEGQAFARRSAGSVAADLWLPGKKRRMRNMDHALNLWRCPKLVRGSEHVFFFHILGMSSSQLTNSIIFRRCWNMLKPPTSRSWGYQYP